MIFLSEVRNFGGNPIAQKSLHIELDPGSSAGILMYSIIVILRSNNSIVKQNRMPGIAGSALGATGLKTRI